MVSSAYTFNYSTHFNEMKNLLYLSITAVLAVVIFACGQSDRPQQAVAGAHKRLTEMDPDEARKAIAKWDSIRGNVIVRLDSMGIPGDSIYVVNGFHVPFDDIQSLVNNIGQEDQLFAMLAVETDSLGNPHYALIFQAPDTTKEHTIRYYDFTKPCPTNCPDK